MKNNKKEKQPYTIGQIFFMIFIIVFVFPIMFNVFKFLTAPIAYFIDIIIKPTGIYNKIAYIAVWALTLFCGFAGAFYICKLIWPKRKLLENSEITTEVKK